MTASPNRVFNFVQPLGGALRGTGAPFRVSFDRRGTTKAGETVADNDGEEDKFSAAGIAAE